MTNARMDNTEAPEGDNISYWYYTNGDYTSERVTVEDGATNALYYSDAAEGQLLEDWYVYDENYEAHKTDVDPMKNGGNYY